MTDLLLEYLDLLIVMATIVAEEIQYIQLYSGIISVNNIGNNRE